MKGRFLSDLLQASASVIADERGGRISAGPSRRHRFLAWAPLLVLLHGAALSAPQNLGGTPDAAYLAAVRGLGLQTEIVYLPPAAPLDLDEEPSPAPDGGSGSGWQLAFDPFREFDGLRWLLIAVAGAVLALLVALVLRNASGGRAIFSRPLDEGSRRGRSAGAAAADQDAALPPGLRLLAELGTIVDRRLALQRLTEHALARATHANGLRLIRSQTARDVVRFLPANWRHVDALDLVVRTEEAVRFGGGPLPDALFADCLAAVRPLFLDHGPA